MGRAGTDPVAAMEELLDLQAFSREPLDDTFEDLGERWDDVEVRGLTYHTDWESTVSFIRQGDKLTLRRDRSNPQYPSAIDVLYRGEKIGSIGNEVAEQVAAYLDAGGKGHIFVELVREPYHEAHTGEGRGNRRFIAGRVFGVVIVKMPKG